MLNKGEYIRDFEKTYSRDDLDKFNIGDTIKVYVKVKEIIKKEVRTRKKEIKEKVRERLQAYEGICIRKRGKGLSRTFTVRKISFGVGVERTFPMNSPLIDKIEIIREGKVRRAKLYYLRDRVGRAATVKKKDIRR